jgi:hypothetical protein
MFPPRGALRETEEKITARLEQPGGSSGAVNWPDSLLGGSRETDAPALGSPNHPSGDGSVAP